MERDKSGINFNLNSSNDIDVDQPDQIAEQEERDRAAAIMKMTLNFEDSEEEDLDNRNEDDFGQEDEVKKVLPWYTFDHASKPRNAWDLFVIALALWNCLYIPFEVAFKPEKTPVIAISDRIIDVLFFVDIVVNFMTSYVHPRTQLDVTEPKRIIKNYIVGGRFWIDLLASIPFDLLIVAEEPDPNVPVEEDGIPISTVTGLLKMVRLLRLGRIISKFRMKSGFKVGFRIF